MNNTVIPPTTELGILRYIEIYIWYDGPCLFMADNEHGEKYLFNLVTYNEYICVFLPEPVADLLESDKITIRDAYKNAVNGYVYIVDHTNGGITKILCHDIPEDYLPDPEALLNKGE